MSNQAQATIDTGNIKATTTEAAQKTREALQEAARNAGAWFGETARPIAIRGAKGFGRLAHSAAGSFLQATGSAIVAGWKESASETRNVVKNALDET